LLHDHAEVLLGPIGPWLREAYPHDDAGLALSWRRGYVDAVNIGHARHAVRGLEALLVHPSGRFLRGVGVGRHAGEPTGATPELRAILDVLLEATPAPPLRAIVFDVRRDPATMSLGALDALGTRYPLLEDVVLEGRARLASIALPRARRFALRSDAMPRDTLAAVLAAEWPSLEDLELGFGMPRRGVGAEIADAGALAPLLAAERMPRLRVLRLATMPFAEALCERLGASPLAARLEELHISGEGMSDDAAGALATGAFPRLRRLVLRCTWVHPVGRAALRDAGLPVEMS
jgi:hypothetical protein